MLATAGLAVALVLRPGDSGLAAEAYVLLVGALGMALLAQAVAGLFPAAAPSRIESVSRPRRKDKRLAGLEKIERELEMATQSAFDPISREPNYKQSAVRIDRSATKGAAR